MEVVDCPDPQDTLSRERLPHTVHQGPTRRAEEVGHLAARCNGIGLPKGSEILLSAYVTKVIVLDSKVRGEHGGCDFAAVCAVADKGVDEARAVSGLDKSAAVRIVRVEYVNTQMLVEQPRRSMLPWLRVRWTIHPEPGPPMESSAALAVMSRTS